MRMSEFSVAQEAGPINKDPAGDGVSGSPG